MQAIEFDRNRIEHEPEAAHKFLEYMEKASKGLVPHEWRELSGPEVTSVALQAFMVLEREINVLEYLRHSGLELH